ncbi:MAG: LLM class F420-dependent oxidoreductase [Acidimicrobiia bacterium]|nr:LLM class F420-dependent oxidoreductase [Acidimicrobiia bacterium]
MGLPRHPFRFGLQVSTAPDRTRWRETARAAEDLGYSTLTVADHLDDQFATTPALMAAAEATTTLRLGALVWCIDYHHPVVLAKEAATVDLLSDGRLEVGLGAGWMASDYQQAGIPMDRPGVRVDRLAEAVTVMKGLLRGDTVTFRGEHFIIDGLAGTPRPRQAPHPPLLIGGGGRRVLTLAAEEADIVGLNIDLRSGHIDETAGPTATADATEEKLRWIRDAAGDRFESLELQVRVHLAAITDDRRGLAEAVGPSLGLTTEQALHSPHALAGTVDDIVEQCQQRREQFGISYIGISADAMDAMAPVVSRLAGT